MADLSDLFNTNSPPRSPPRRSPSPTPTPGSPPTPLRPRRSSNPLFFSPGVQSENGTTPFGRSAHTGRRDLSRSVSPSDHASGSRPAPPPPPPERSARPGGEDEDEGIPTRLLGFEDPFAALNGDGNGVGGDGDEDGEDAGGKKRKRIIAKIDGDRLTSDRGFPALCRAAKKFKVKGKGHEASDLRSLLNLYQMWAHGMFPKGDFAGTINRVETVCRSRRMESAIKGYREAFYPKAASPSPQPRDFSPISDVGSGSGPDIHPDRENNGQSNENVSEPLFAPLGGDGQEDDVDMDELMALEEMEREQAQAQLFSTARTAGAGTGGVDDGPPVLQEEDEWEGLYD